jgi:integrase/recombinase XerD
MSRSIHAAQGEPLPYNHHLHQFLTFLKHERGFADATIVNRERSLNRFLGWLVAQDVPLSTVSPATITKYFTSAVAGRWKRTTISFHVYSLRSFFRYATNRGWCATGIAESIDAPRVYTYENLPQGPTWEEVKKLVTSVNGASPVQIRSRCAILLCSVYGLRAGEVCCLRLEDIDWAEERISVRRPKQRKAQTYPLTTRGWECTSAVSEGGEAAIHATRSLADTQATIPARFGWRSFHDDSEATKEARVEA